MSPDQRAAKLAIIEQFDPWANLRNKIRTMAQATENWAGIPMPFESVKLVIESSYPNAQELMDLTGKRREGKDNALDANDGAVIRNSWWSDRLRGEVIIWQERDGRILGARMPVPSHHFTIDLETFACMDAWGIEQEANAVNLLGTLTSHRQFKSYMLTGSFIETSKRSHLAYVFRRLKPTVVINKDQNRILAALCLHPIGYYQGSWAGAMCPTDDVVAHLMLMRGDEHMFWKRSNQHHPIRPEAGL